LSSKTKRLALLPGNNVQFRKPFPKGTMPKLLILSKQADAYRQLLESAHLPDLTPTTVFSPDCELIFGEPTLIRDFLPRLPALKWAQATWAGVEPLLDPTLRRDYLLTNARGVFGALVSEYVFGYLLLRERRMLQRLQSQQQGTWDATLTGRLHGKTIGLLGVGSIGAHLARTAKHFGLTVRGYTRASTACPDVDVYYHGADLLAFASGLDYLVSVLPNTSQTQKIIRAEVLAALPPHAILINVGRGSAVDEAALIQALETEALAGAVLDVFAQEPLPAQHPFWRTKNLLLTFHTAAPSFPADIVELFIANYRRYLRGDDLQYRVDFERGY
jgi:phosphoglycerate dehydrogenase-like enzyme